MERDFGCKLKENYFLPTEMNIRAGAAKTFFTCQNTAKTKVSRYELM